LELPSSTPTPRFLSCLLATTPKAYPGATKTRILYSSIRISRTRRRGWVRRWPRG
jgi:hypothetical protein